MIISDGMRESMLDIAGLTYKEHLNRGGTLEICQYGKYAPTYIMLPAGAVDFERRGSSCKLKAIARTVPGEGGHWRWQIDNVVDIRDILNVVGQGFGAYRSAERGKGGVTGA